MTTLSTLCITGKLECGLTRVVHLHVGNKGLGHLMYVRGQTIEGTFSKLINPIYISYCLIKRERH